MGKRLTKLARYGAGIAILGCSACTQSFEVPDNEPAETDSFQKAQLPPATHTALDPVTTDEGNTPNNARAPAVEGGLLLSEAGCPNVNINVDKELMITSTNVVDDALANFDASAPNAARWSFPYLMAQMKPGNLSTSAFIEAWLDKWNSVTEVNGYPVEPRPAINDLVIDAWPRLSNGELDLEQAPFRLLAIVFRPDLRNAQKQQAGEGRFVFGVVGGRRNRPQQFTVILEYRLPTEFGMSASTWYQRIHALGGLQGKAYTDALVTLTDAFSKGSFGGLINGSAINQVRTNEIALNRPWEMREFRLANSSKQLAQVPVALTPAEEFHVAGRRSADRSAELAQLLIDNADAVLSFQFEVPTSFLGASALVPATRQWLQTRQGNVGGIDENLRFAFAINTCDGCHQGENPDTQFLMIKNRQPGQESGRAPFVEQDLVRREDDFAQLLCGASLSTPAAEMSGRTH